MISREEPLWCDDEQRNAVLAAPAHPLNGIDFVEYRRNGPLFQLEVHFIKPAPAGLTAASFRVEGGVRIVDVRVTGVAVTVDPAVLAVMVDREGDLSTYWLHVTDAGIDPERSEAAFGFKAGCPTEFDCRPRHDCEPDASVEPALDYLAKDYQSFRRLMIDLAPQLNPDFTERNPADLTVTLIELFAYVGDYLSYWQDAAVTEAFFDTCRERVSAARHARLIDQAMHNGRNAFGFVQFDAGVAGTVPAGTALLTRVTAPLRGAAAPPGLVIPVGGADFDGDPALERVTVFETAAPVRVLPGRNALRIHDWGDASCCLAKGARDVWLYAFAGGVATRPDVLPGEYLLIEEILGPATGLAADADPRNRQVVRIEAVEATSDPVFNDRLLPFAAGDTALPLLRVRWREQDATTMPFCLSAELPGSQQRIGPVSIVRGNVTTADHGRTVVRRFADPAFALPPVQAGGGRWPIDTQLLGEGPLTFQTMPAEPGFAADGRLATGRHDLDQPAAVAMPAVTVEYGWAGLDTELFRPVVTLIGSDSDDPHFVAEVDDAGRARLRFGDDQYGRRVTRPSLPDAARARYRIGNGRAGNIGAGALVHVVEPSALDRVDPANPSAGPLPFPALTALRQPLPGRGGTDPQTIAEVRQLAPEAFRAETYRAVTTADYEAAAMQQPGVAAAQARFVWTGSWHTVFVAIHPADAGQLRRLPGGGALLVPDFAARIGAAIGRYRLAGYDLVVRAASYVPIELEIQLCILRGHFRGAVLEAAHEALSSRRLAGGATGFFHPANFRFGTPVYASRILAALQAVDGVESATIRVMKRYWDAPNGELERGLVAMGPGEVARLEDDRNQPEFGVLRLSAVGGL
jgi:hypothetical protein